MKNLYKLAMVVALGGSFALAQNMPRQQDPQNPSGQQTPQNPSGVPQSQQPPVSDQGQGKASDQDAKPSAGTMDAQNDIQSAIQKDPTLASANINVRVTDKDVVLSGTAPSKEAKETAEQIAKTHSGGLQVKNHIKVSSKGSANPGSNENPK